MKIPFRNSLASLVISAALLMPAYACALTGGPDGGGYTFIDSSEAGGPAYSFEDIAHVDNSLAMYGDDSARLVQMDFGFRFYGALFNSVHVSSNGHLDFREGWGNENFNINNSPIPQASSLDPGADNGWGVNSLIAPFFDDLNPVADGDIYVDQRGTEPNRRLIVQWEGIPHYDCELPVDSANNMSIQAILYEGSNGIEFHYRDVTTSNSTILCQEITGGGSATVGLDFNSSVGLQYSANTAALFNGLAIRFQPGPDPAIVPSTASVDLGNVLIGNTSTVTIELNNAGGDMLSIGNITSQLNAPFTILSDNCTGTGVAMGGLCTLSLAFGPSSTGAFSDTLIINSNDPDDSPLSINLTGISFTAAPSIPQLVYPGNGANGIPSAFTFQWDRSSDPDPGDTVTYEVYYTEDEEYQANGFTNTTAAGPMAKAGPSGKAMYAAASVPGVFFMAGLALLAPVSRRRKVLAAVMLIVIIVMSLAGCGNGLTETDDPVPASYDISGIQSGTTYHWKVVATDSYGFTAESAVWSFTTQ